jgi:hypothetical protein
MVQGAVTTGAPTYTTGQIDPLSLTTAGALRVDSSAVTQPVSGTFWQATQPVSGTVTANQGGSNWTVNVAQINGVTPLMGNGVTGTGSQRVTIASDNTAFSVNAIQSGTWNIGTLTSITNTVNVASATAPASTMNSASATGGIASAMAAVFDDVTPTAITENNFGYVRMSANRNQYTTIRDAAGNERGVNVSAGNALLVDASATTQPVSIAAAVTVQQSTAANLLCTASQGGTWNITNISGTVSLPTGAATSANQPTNAALGSTTTGQTGHLALGAVTTAAPSYTTAQSNALSLDTSGNLRIIGTVTATQSGTWVSNITQFGGTNISTGVGAGGAGIPRVTVSNDSNILATQSGTWTVQPGNTANTTPWLTTARIVGNTGATLDVVSSQNAAMPTNMLVFGGEYNTTPTAITSGNCSPLQVDTRGRLISVNSLRANKGVQKTSITVATETTVVTAGAAGVFQDVYAITVTNKSATSVFVDFKDATAGTTRMTLAAPANDTRGFTVTADSAMVQAAAANNWTATVSSAVTSIEITMLFVSNVA